MQNREMQETELENVAGGYLYSRPHNKELDDAYMKIGDAIRSAGEAIDRFLGLREEEDKNADSGMHITKHYEF